MFCVVILFLSSLSTSEEFYKGRFFILNTALFFSPDQIPVQTFAYNSVLLTGLEFNYTVRDYLCPCHWFLIDFNVIRNCIQKYQFGVKMKTKRRVQCMLRLCKYVFRLFVRGHTVSLTGFMRQDAMLFQN